MLLYALRLMWVEFKYIFRVNESFNVLNFTLICADLTVIGRRLKRLSGRRQLFRLALLVPS